MTFEEEMDKFWTAFDSRQREWMESQWEPYRRAVQNEDVVRAQEIVTSFFSGSERRQIFNLKKHGITSWLVSYKSKGRVVIPGPSKETLAEC